MTERGDALTAAKLFDLEGLTVVITGGKITTPSCHSLNAPITLFFVAEICSLVTRRTSPE